MLDLNEIEILQVALAHEERARAYYERQAGLHRRTPAGALFDFLAGEEEGHIRKLSARFGVPGVEAKWEHKYLPYLIDLERVAREQEAEGNAVGDDPVLRGLLVAKAAEEHAVEFYGKAAEAVEDGNTKDLLSELREEERIHLARIEEFRKKV